MIEKLIFELLAFSLFIIIFFKIIRKNDTNYISVLILQAIGIAISFIEIKLSIWECLPLEILRYMLSIIIPVIIIIIEIKGINFSESLSILLSKFFIITGNSKKAKSILVKLVTKYPESYLGHKMLAECYEKEGGMRRAIDEFVTAVDIKKNDYKSYFKITKLLNDLGKKDESIQMLENLLKTKPDCYEASIFLGELLCEQERLKEAVNVYSEALKYKPNDFDLYYNLGIAYTRLSDFQMAKEMYEMAAELNHKMYALNYNMGLIVFIQKDYDLAEVYFKKALDSSYEAEAYYCLAKIYISKNEKDMAINFLNKAIELKPELLKKAGTEPLFETIKEYITVSVKMEEDVKKEGKEDNDTRPEVIIKQEKKAIKYLEDTTRLIESMNESDERARIEKKLDYMFKKTTIKKPIKGPKYIENYKKLERDERNKN